MNPLFDAEAARRVLAEHGRWVPEDPALLEEEARRLVAVELPLRQMQLDAWLAHPPGDEAAPPEVPPQPPRRWTMVLDGPATRGRRGGVAMVVPEMPRAMNHWQPLFDWPTRRERATAVVAERARFVRNWQVNLNSPAAQHMLNMLRDPARRMERVELREGGPAFVKRK